MKDRMKIPALEGAFDDKIYCELTGDIYKMEEKEWGTILYVKDNRILLSNDSRYLCESIMIYTYEEDNYQIGNQIKVKGELQKFSKATNLGQFDEKKFYNIQQIDYRIKADEVSLLNPKVRKLHMTLYRWKQKLMRIYDDLLPEREAGTIKAMLLGEKYLLEEEIKELYKENGIAHILAISGLHISLIGLSIYQLLHKLRIPILLSTTISIGFLYAYGVLTNFSVSTNRAVVMLVIYFMAKVFGKTYDLLSAISLSAFLILLKNPMQLYSTGFLLSFGAILGIALILPCLQKLFPMKSNVTNGLFVSISAQIMTLPIILSFYYQLPFYSVIINLLVLPFMSLIVLTSLMAGIAGQYFLPLGVLLIGGARYLLWLIEWICKIGSSLPNHMITIGKPELYRIVVYYGFVMVFLWIGSKCKSRLSLFVSVSTIVLILLPRSNVGLELTMLDVGQGEAIVMETSRGTTYLIDGGSSNVNKVGTYRIQPFLLARGVRKIDYLFITHMHYDHYSGVIDLIENREIKINHIVLPKFFIRDKAYQEFTALVKKHGIPLLYIEAGDTFRDGDLILTCLHPSAQFLMSNVNSYSMVLDVTYKEFDLLLTGDLELDGERVLVDYFQNTTSTNVSHKYEVLKVAHHGSKNSTFEEFLYLINPEYSLISCAKKNRYGHPNEELLERLQRKDTNVYKTSTDGMITIKTDGEKMKVERYTDFGKSTLP